jgi:amino acid adenylation domain-containing protein
VLGAFAHQEVPFEKLVEELHPERDLWQTPLFQTMMVLQNVPEESAQMSDLQLTPLNAAVGTAKFDTTLGLMERGGELFGGIEYKKELFDAATMERLASHFEQLLECIAANPDERIDRYPLLNAAERQQLLVEWNDTTKPFADEACLHELFEAQVSRTPNAIALSYDDTSLTYLELNERSNQLAHYLRSLGVGPDIPVALCLQRGIEMIVAILGVLKAGGAYVPLDPNYPQERLAFMLEDSKAPVLLTQTQLLGQLPKSPARVLCLDEEGEAISAGSEANPESHVASRNLAYIIYTSGSTGRPKGVALEHRSAAAFLHWVHETFTPAELAAVLGSTSICFDLSVFEIFAPLTCGGKVVIAENALQLPSLKAAHEVTLLNTVPSAMTELLRIDGVPDSVRTINLAGEPLKLSLAQQVYQRPSVERLFNLYGPSEDTTYSTWSLLEPGISTPPSIGRPIANTQAYILDGAGEPVPVGVSGELYLGGDGLARGYFNRSELTAERFVPNKFSAEPGARLYRTGDLARYLPDGRIDFLGRIDHQVKVRGFRIEVGEIESVLSSHPDVRDCIVTARTNEDGVRLVAYVVTDEQQVNGQLRQHLLQQLPDYMVPSDFVFLEALPLTPNGKVNRQALPAPGQSARRRDAFVAPRDTLELKLANIWEEVLKTQPIGVTDDFFALGGHSLMAVQVFALIDARLRKKIPLTTLFKGATVEQLATLIRLNDSAAWSPLVEIKKGGSRRPLFLIHPGGGGVLSYMELAQHLGTEQPVYGLNARGLDEGQQPHTRVEDMAAEYLEAIRKVQPHGPYLLGGWSVGGIIAFEIAHQLEAQNEQVSLLGIIDSTAPSIWASNAKADELSVLFAFAQDLGLTANLLTVTRKELLQMSSEERLLYLEERAKSAKIIPQYIDHDQIVRLYQVFKTNTTALQQYKPAARVRRITLISSEKSASMIPDSTMGWSELSTETVRSEESSCGKLWRPMTRSRACSA